MPEFDVVIRGGMVVDGTRMPRYRADVGIKDGKVAAIGHVAAHEGARVLDGDGLVVAPGFVDLHTHYDAQLFWDPHCSISGWHGVTSVVIGNCGFGFAPVRPEERERAMRTMTRVEAIPYETMREGLPWDWVSYPEFLDSVERAPKALNVLPFVPVAPLLIWVMGLDAAKNRDTTADERAEIKRLLHEAMDAGGCGWSAQRLPPEGGFANQRDYDGTPMVTDVMSDATQLALAEVLGERNEGFMQMTLATGDPQRDFQHMERLAETARRPIIYNAVQPIETMPGNHRGLLNWIDSCRRRGILIYGQGVTVDAGQTFSLDDWNCWDDAEEWCDVLLGTPEERKAKLADPSRRARLREQQPHTFIAEWSKIAVIKVNDPDLKHNENLTLGDIAERDGVHIVDAMVDLAVADDLNTVFWSVGPNSNVEFFKEIMDYRWSLFGVSDGGAHTKFSTSGRYPTQAIEQWVREHEFLDLEEVHWRLSGLPAVCAGFKDRGTLRVGAPADVVVYDFERLRSLPEEVVHDLPGGEWRRVQRAEGYEYVLVNGEVVIESDKPTGLTPGALLRHGQAST